MWIKILVYLLFLIVPLAVFTYLSYQKRPQEFDYRLIRRIYFIFTIISIYVFVWAFSSEIRNLNIFRLRNIDSNALDFTAIAAILFLFFVLWEYIFISCKSFSNIKFKDLELTVNDLSQVKYTDAFQEKQINSLYAVLNAKNKMLKYIDYYIREKELNPSQSYTDILNEYPHKRKGIKLLRFYNNPSGLQRMQKDLKLNHEVLSSIMYAISLYGFCTPPDFRKEDYIFALIRTKYTEDDIIIVLKSGFLIDKEYMVLIDIINYFELKLDLEILKTTVAPVTP